MKTVGIFPASGALGTSTYTHLLSKVPNDNVTLISRFPEKRPKPYMDNGVVCRQASYESSAEDLLKAFSGIDVLFLISYPSHQHQLRTQLQLPAIDAAYRAGVKHIFYSSLAFALSKQKSTKAEVMGAHLDSEAYLENLAKDDPAFSWTTVREGLYSESYPIYTAFFDVENPSTRIRIPHDGSGRGVSWVKRDELGEATAQLIANYAKDPSGFNFINQIVEFTGSKEWTLAETVALVSRVLGTGISIEEVSVEEYAEQSQVLAGFGSKELAKTWATAWDAIRAGETAPVVVTLREVLGREPEAYETTICELLSRYLPSFIT